jgi:hypothetical protein
VDAIFACPDDITALNGGYSEKKNGYSFLAFDASLLMRLSKKPKNKFFIIFAIIKSDTYMR